MSSLADLLGYGVASSPYRPAASVRGRLSEAYTTPGPVIERGKDVIILRDCKLLGERSKNPKPHNNVYPRRTREKAIPLLEGARVFADHERPGARGTRSIKDMLGVVRNVREKGNGLFGDFHLNAHHPDAERIVSDARMSPRGGIGFSISGNGQRRPMPNGDVIVESIDEIMSVDLVVEPATTNGLFESQTRRKRRTMLTTVRRLREQLTRKGKHRHARILREAVDPSSGMLTDDETVEVPSDAMEPDEPMSDSSADEALRAGFESAWTALFNDPMPTAAKVAQAKKLLKALDDLTGKGGGGSGDTATLGDEEEVTESRRRYVRNLRESSSGSAIAGRGRAVSVEDRKAMVAKARRQ